MEILTKENLLSGRKLLPLQFPGLRSLTKGNQVSLVRIHSSLPESDGKIGRRWGWGSNWDPELKFSFHGDCGGQ